MNEFNTFSWKFVEENLLSEKNPFHKIKGDISPRHCNTLDYLTGQNIIVSMKYLHSTHMMNYTSMEDWKEFLHSYRTMVLECFFSCQNDSGNMQKNFHEMVQHYEKQHCQRFLLEHSFRPVEIIFKNETMTPFEKSRLIIKLIDNYSSKTNLFCHFTYEHWKVLFENRHFLIENRYDWDKIYKLIYAKIPVPLKIELQNVNLQKYQIFLQDNLHFPNNPLDCFFFNFLFHSQTNVQDGNVWIRNEKPYTIRLNGEAYTEKDLDTLRNTTMTVSIFQKIPYSFVPSHHRNYLKNLCHHATGGMLPFETWKFFDTKRNHITLETILKECFHIVGRISLRYKLREYHTSFFQKIEKSALIWKKLHSAPNSILFPEYSFQTKEWKDSWNKQWNRLYQIFLLDVFECMTGTTCTKEYFLKDYKAHLWSIKLFSYQKEYEDSVKEQKTSIIPALYEPKQKTLRSRISEITEKIQKSSPKPIDIDLIPMTAIEKDIGDFIGSEHLLDVLNKKQTYSQYFNKDSFLPVHKPPPYTPLDHQRDFMTWYDMQSFSKRNFSNPKKRYDMFIELVESQMSQEKKIFAL